jgi:hypothetical protein
MKKIQIVRKTYEKVLNCYFNIKILEIILPSHFLFVSLHLVEVDLVRRQTWKGNIHSAYQICSHFEKKL